MNRLNKVIQRCRRWQTGRPNQRRCMSRRGRRSQSCKGRPSQSCRGRKRNMDRTISSSKRISKGIITIITHCEKNDKHECKWRIRLVRISWAMATEIKTEFPISKILNKEMSNYVRNWSYSVFGHLTLKNHGICSGFCFSPRKNTVNNSNFAVFSCFSLFFELRWSAIHGYQILRVFFSNNQYFRMFLVSMADIIGSYERSRRCENNIVQTVAAAQGFLSRSDGNRREQWQ